MKNLIILILSFISLIISGIWAYKTNYDYEPIIVFIMGIVSILYHFLKPKKEVQTTKNNQQNKTTQTVNVNINNEQASPISYKEDKIEKTITRNDKIESMKTRYKILFIDDDKNFKVVKILKNSGWKHTKSIVDIKSVDQEDVMNSDLFFVDINGIGKILDLPNEGLDIALMLKQRYPNKKVVIYSANSKNNVFHEVWDLCDLKLEKNALPYQFQSIVEQYSIINY